MGIRAYSGLISGLFRAYFELISRLTLGNRCVVGDKGLFRAYFGLIPGLFRAYSWLISGLFRAYFGLILGRIPGFVRAYFWADPDLVPGHFLLPPLWFECARLEDRSVILLHCLAARWEHQGLYAKGGGLRAGGRNCYDYCQDAFSNTLRKNTTKKYELSEHK